MWHNKKPNLKYLKVFGSIVYVHQKVRKRKFDDKSSKAILVGFEPNGFRLWDLSARKFVVARDVIVDEATMNSRADADSVADSGFLNENKKHEALDLIDNPSDSGNHKGHDDILNKSKDCKNSDLLNVDLIAIPNKEHKGQKGIRNESTEENADICVSDDQSKNSLETPCVGVESIGKQCDVRRSERLMNKPATSFKQLFNECAEFTQ